MIKLSVNINKVALVRNSRGHNNPDLIRTALDLLSLGAQGITVHPRPDGRHIRTQDVFDLKSVLGETELNVEGYPSEDFLKMIEAVRPAQCTLVPDPPEALTSSAGWDTITHQGFLREVIARVRSAGVRASIFIETDLRLFEPAKTCGADRIELYTEAYANTYVSDRRRAIAPYISAAAEARKCGLGVNAGHDLSLENLAYLNQEIPFIDEVSIGHALVCDALYLGWKETLRRYLACLA